MTIETPRVTLGSIQCLRGIAALMVVLYHLTIRMERIDPRFAHVDVLMAGVDIFFVISGFIMYVTTLNRPDRSWFEFLRDRVIRIAPPYWVITAMIVMLIGLAKLVGTGGADIPVTSPWHILSSFLFIASQHPGKIAYHPVLIAGWTLNLEMFFYLIFAGAMAAASSRMGWRSVLILTTLVTLVAIGRLVDARGTAQFYLSDLLLEFGGGVVVGILYGRGVRVRSRFWWLSCIAGFTLLAVWGHPHGYLRAVEWGIPAMLIVGGAVFAPDIGMTFLRRLGDWSYSLYLTHQVTLAGAQMAWLALAPRWGFALPLFAVPVSISLAWLYYAAVEVPLTSYLSAKLSHPSRSRSHTKRPTRMPVTSQRAG